MLVLLSEACRGMLENWYIHVFLWLIMFDIFTGLAKALIIKKNGDSTKGLLGLVKHLLVALLVVVAYPYLVVIGLQEIATTFVLFYIAMYGISVIENLGQLGIPIPTFIKDRFAKLKDTTDKGEKEK